MTPSAAFSSWLTLTSPSRICCIPSPMSASSALPFPFAFAAAAASCCLK